MILPTTSLCITEPEVSPNMKERKDLSHLCASILQKCWHHSLEEFAQNFKIPSQGVCVYTPEWPISSLHNGVDSHPYIYPPPHEDSSLICDALFYERTQPKTRKMKEIDTILDPFQMIVSELKTHLKK
ncbi:hypothetical protein Tco_0295461 [Tanacetum coccineum]